MNWSRRDSFKILLGGLGLATGYQLISTILKTRSYGQFMNYDELACSIGTKNLGSPKINNFRTIYTQPELKAKFLDFLTHIYHLYPEQDFHAVIDELRQQHAREGMSATRFGRSAREGKAAKPSLTRTTQQARDSSSKQASKQASKLAS